MTRDARRLRRALLVPVLWMAAPVSPATAQWLQFDVPERPPTDVANAELGRAIYDERCWFCHGDEGDGNGPIADYLWPRPRDFTAGSYKLRTTHSGELPTDEDLFRTISLGIPGTAMPEWRTVLSRDERWQVVSYIKTFAADLFEDEAFDPYQAVITVPEPPSGSAEARIERGRQLFLEVDCFECHGRGARGEGERAGELTDDWDVPVQPVNLYSGWKFKGGRSVRDIYLRLTSGLDGTPMPSYSLTTSEEERWQLASYVAALADSAESDRSTDAVITARRLNGNLPERPDDAAWEAAPGIRIPLSGQATFPPRWQIPAVTDLEIKAVYNGEELALRLAWDDPFLNAPEVDSAIAMGDDWDGDGDTYPVLTADGGWRRQTHPDGVEVMFPVHFGGSPVLPHFVYGDGGHPVDLWRWQANAEHPLDGPQVVTEFRAGGAQRPPERHPPESQRAGGRADWQEGQWTVVIRRPLDTGEGSREVQLRAGQLVPIAFHVWEGANGEVGLKMALSSWYFLLLQEPVPLRAYLVVLLTVSAASIFVLGLVRGVRRRAERGELVQYGIEPTRSGFSLAR